MAETSKVQDDDIFIPILYGRALRFVLVDMIRRKGTMTVAEMVSELAMQGYDLPGRPSKVISDALRWERARGRIVRVRRGVYRHGRAPATTARRIRIFAGYCSRWLVAVMRDETPPPTPEDLRHYPSSRVDLPLRSPWENTAWLWTM